MIARMISHCYCFTYQSLQFDIEESYISPLMTNVKMYALGEKYEIQSLKKAAIRLFDMFLNSRSEEWKPEIEDIEKIISEVFGSTPESNRGLRDPLIAFVAQSWPSLSSTSEFKLKTIEVPELAIGVIDKLAKENGEGEACKKRSTTEISQSLFGGWFD